MRRAEEVKGHLNRGLPVALVSLWRAEMVKGHLSRGKFRLSLKCICYKRRQAPTVF